MAILDASRKAFGVALGSYELADEICDIIDAGTGTLSNKAHHALQVALGKTAGTDFFTIVNAADGAIADSTLNRLRVACAAKVAANDINAGIVANVD